MHPKPDVGLAAGDQPRAASFPQDTSPA